MPVSDSRAIVERFLAASEARDVDTLRSLAAPDLRIIEAESLPFGGEHVGLDGFRGLVRHIYRLWEMTRVTVDRMFVDGETVVVLARLQGRSRVDGSAIEMPIAEIWELHGGRVHTIRPFYLDTHRLLETLRCAPPAGDDIT